MASPRSELIVLQSTPYYHCIARCVRRAFLCGRDAYSGQCFDHRKEWLTARIKLLAEVFAIDIAAYAVMSNHYHLVLHVDKARAKSWSRDEVIERWLRLHKGPVLAQRYHQGEQLSESEVEMLGQVVETWRERLYSISWFMARLNEYIARRANKEDECKGRFWEARFISRGLEDISALVSCMTYVDLNPVRAGLADSPETADFTSVQQRLQEEKPRGQQFGAGNTQKKRTKCFSFKPRLMPFRQARKEDASEAKIPFSLEPYLELVETSCQAIVKNKEGSPAVAPQTLASLNITITEWLTLSLDTHKHSKRMLNGLAILAEMGKRARKNKTA